MKRQPYLTRDIQSRRPPRSPARLFIVGEVMPDGSVRFVRPTPGGSVAMNRLGAVAEGAVAEGAQNQIRLSLVTDTKEKDKP